jgi:hypothetical protein
LSSPINEFAIFALSSAKWNAISKRVGKNKMRIRAHHEFLGVAGEEEVEKERRPANAGR